MKSENSDTITRTESFAGTIQRGPDGNHIIVLKSKRYYANQMNKMKVGIEVTMEVHTRKPKRTEQQNRYYWGAYLPLIASETGEHNLDRLHELFKGKFLTIGIYEVLGSKVRITKSTTELGIAEFSNYITDIEVDTGVKPPPTENYGLMSLAEGRDYKK